MYICACIHHSGHTRLLPVLKDKHIDSRFTSQLLTELVSHESSTSEHINYLLFKIKIDSKRAPSLFYNASKISPSQLLKKSIRELKVYEVLVDYGMPVMAEDIAYACLLYTSPSPRDATLSRMPSSA